MSIRAVTVAAASAMAKMPRACHVRMPQRYELLIRHADDMFTAATYDEILCHMILLLRRRSLIYARHLRC